MESCKISSVVQCVVDVNMYVHKDNYEMVIIAHQQILNLLKIFHYTVN